MGKIVNREDPQTIYDAFFMSRPMFIDVYSKKSVESRDELAIVWSQIRSDEDRIDNTLRVTPWESVMDLPDLNNSEIAEVDMSLSPIIQKVQEDGMKTMSESLGIPKDRIGVDDHIDRAVEVGDNITVGVDVATGPDSSAKTTFKRDEDGIVEIVEVEVDKSKPKSKKERIAELHAEGKKTAEIAAEIGAHPNYVRGVIKNL